MECNWVSSCKDGALCWACPPAVLVPVVLFGAESEEAGSRAEEAVMRGTIRHVRNAM